MKNTYVQRINCCDKAIRYPLGIDTQTAVQSVSAVVEEQTFQYCCDKTIRYPLGIDTQTAVQSMSAVVEEQTFQYCCDKTIRYPL